MKSQNQQCSFPLKVSIPTFILENWDRRCFSYREDAVLHGGTHKKTVVLQLENHKQLN